MKVLLVRHLESEANFRNVFGGFDDVDLSKYAIRDVSKVKDLYKNLDLTNFSFITSDLKRCYRSLELIFDVKDYKIIKDFRETNFGDFTGVSKTILKTREDYKKWCSGDLDYAPNNGESYNQMASRVVNAFKEVIKVNKDIVLVISSGPITAIMRYLFNDTSNFIYTYALNNGCGFLVDLDNKNFITIK